MLFRNFRGAVRQLGHAPGFVCAAALTLVLGVGITTAVIYVIKLEASVINEKTLTALWTLTGAALAVLAIACVNVAVLLLIRSVKREREIAMRAAVGAKPERLIAQVLTEGLLLAIPGAAGGFGVSLLLLGLMRELLTKAFDRGADIHPGWAMLGIAIVIAAASSLAASFYPALRLSRLDLSRVLKAGFNASAERSQHRLRSAFMVAQAALTLLLLVVAGLFMRGVLRYRNLDLGFDPSHILSLKIGLSKTNYQKKDPLAAFYRPLEERLRQLPGVQAAGLIDMIPIEKADSYLKIHLLGQPPVPNSQQPSSAVRFVSMGYFDVMRIPLYRGRWLSPALDRAENPAPTLVANQVFVDNFIPNNLDPTAQRIDSLSPNLEEWAYIVGITGNVRQSLERETLPELDYLMDELDFSERANMYANMHLLVRTAGDPKQVIPAVRSIMHELDPTAAFTDPRTMTEVVSDILAPERIQSLLFAILAGLALALTLVGIYALATLEAEMATHDISVRLALGATRNHVLRIVLGRMAWRLSTGVVIGLLLSVAAGETIESIIHFDAQLDARGLLLVSLLLVISGLAITLIPAFRAASIAPMRALHVE